MKTDIHPLPTTYEFRLTERHLVMLTHLIANSINEHYGELERCRNAVECGQINDDLACLYSLREELQNPSALKSN